MSKEVHSHNTQMKFLLQIVNSIVFLSSSYRTKMKAPPMPLSPSDQASLKKALPPSSCAIFLQQSIAPLYIMSAKIKRKFKKNYIMIFKTEHNGTPKWLIYFGKNMERNRGWKLPPLRPDCIIIRRCTMSKRSRCEGSDSFESRSMPVKHKYFNLITKRMLLPITC